MIINDTHRFAFIHIPKCAGTTMRAALAPHDESSDRFYDKGVMQHPVLGPLDYHHLPLAVLREYFPEDFARLGAYRSFALVRDPFDRFPSSLHERLVQRDRRPLNLRDEAEIAREVEAVLGSLARHPDASPIIDPELIHFSRQCDYIFLDGRQVVGCPRTVAEIRVLLEDLSDIFGEQIHFEESKNRRLNYAIPAMWKVQRAVTGPIEKALPRWIWKPAYKPIKKIFRSTGLIRTAARSLADFPNRSEIEAFIAEFYADDIRLFQRLVAERHVRASKDAVD